MIPFSATGWPARARATHGFTLMASPSAEAAALLALPD